MVGKGARSVPCGTTADWADASVRICGWEATPSPVVSSVPAASQRECSARGREVFERLGTPGRRFDCFQASRRQWPLSLRNPRTARSFPRAIARIAFSRSAPGRDRGRAACGRRALAPRGAFYRTGRGTSRLQLGGRTGRLAARREPWACRSPQNTHHWQRSLNRYRSVRRRGPCSRAGPHTRGGCRPPDSGSKDRAPGGTGRTFLDTAATLPYTARLLRVGSSVGRAVDF